MYDCTHSNRATGTLTKCSQKKLETIPGNHLTDLVQKTAIHGTLQIIWKVLQSENCSLSCGDHRWFKRSTGEKRALTGDKSKKNNNNNTKNNNIIIIIIIY
jgi:hypothetical protein